VLCNFSMLDAVNRDRLFKAYCSSFYGCPLWDLNTKKTWMSSVLHGGKVHVDCILPYDAGCDVVYLLAGVIPVYDEICHRVINFIQSCWNSDSEFVKYIVNLGINVSCMWSPIGQNAYLCSTRLNVPICDLFVKCLPYRVFQKYWSKVSLDDNVVVVL